MTSVSFADLTPLFFVHRAKTEAIYARFWGLPCRYLFAIPTNFDVALFPMHLDQPAGSGLSFQGWGQQRQICAAGLASPVCMHWYIHLSATLPGWHQHKVENTRILV